MLILRERKEEPRSNGVWIATRPGNHESLKNEFPSLRSISLFTDGSAETSWQMIPSDADDFESSVIKVCELIRKGDKRIGKP
jgi:hypothetical protein